MSVEVRYDGGAVDAGPLGKIGSRGASHSRFGSAAKPRLSLTLALPGAVIGIRGAGSQSVSWCGDEVLRRGFLSRLGANGHRDRERQHPQEDEQGEGDAAVQYGIHDGHDCCRDP